MDPLENLVLAAWGAVVSAWADVHAGLFQAVVQPALFHLGLTTWIEMAFDWTEVFLIGVAEIVVLGVTLTLLERWRPVERWADRRAVRVDVLYTVLVRLGVLPLAIFFLLLPLVDGVDGWLRMRGFIPPKLEDAFPALFAHPAASFAAYLVIIDFAMYGIHRAQHRLGFWWALHAVHHSQREMTFWTDDRNHLLDMVITDLALAVVAACAVLTYGGVSLFVVAFSVYPMALSLFRQADLPRRFIPATLAFGSVTFTMTSAGSPSAFSVHRALSLRCVLLAMSRLAMARMVFRRFSASGPRSRSPAMPR